MIKFNFLTDNRKIILAAQMIAPKIDGALSNDEIIRELKEMTFDSRYTKPANFSGHDIAWAIKRLNQTINVGTYTQGWMAYKFTPVNAYKPANKFDQIFFNTRNLTKRRVLGPNSTEETLWHELVHIVDHLSLEKFDHGDNSLAGKNESAPVKFANYMAKLSL